MNWLKADGDGVIWHLRGLHIPVLGVNKKSAELVKSSEKCVLE